MLGQVRVGLLGRVHGAQQTVREVQGWPLVQHRNLWKTYVGTVTLWARADNILKYSVAMKKGWELGHAHEWVKNYAQAGKPDKGKTPEVGRGQTGCFERARKKGGKRQEEGELVEEEDVYPVGVSAWKRRAHIRMEGHSGWRSAQARAVHGGRFLGECGRERSEQSRSQGRRGEKERRS